MKSPLTKYVSAAVTMSLPSKAFADGEDFMSMSDMTSLYSPTSFDIFYPQDMSIFFQTADVASGDPKYEVFAAIISYIAVFFGSFYKITRTAPKLRQTENGLEIDD